MTAVRWWTVSRRPAMVWPIDDRRPEPLRLSLDVFFELHRLGVIDRLKGYVLEAQRAQVRHDRHARFRQLWAEVEHPLPYRVVGLEDA